jgi:DNA-binding winged helix-turn-helix (wHTH) protein
MATVYRFGDFTFDLDSRRLHLHDREVHLTPKAFDLLQLLIDNRDRALPKSELQQRIWPATFVEETNLASLVAEIRRALSGGQWIRTVYGFGYQFTGHVAINASPRELETLWLTVERRQIPLMEGKNVIGRAPDAAIPLDSPGISRHHARIDVANGEATLEDVGSKNGTQLNGRRIEMPVRLADGDEIRIGAATLIFRIGSQTTATVSMSMEDD